jgi:hypothetical protein
MWVDCWWVDATAGCRRSAGAGGVSTGREGGKTRWCQGGSERGRECWGQQVMVMQQLSSSGLMGCGEPLHSRWVWEGIYMRWGSSGIQAIGATGGCVVASAMWVRLLRGVLLTPTARMGSKCLGGCYRQCVVAALAAVPCFLCQQAGMRVVVEWFMGMHTPVRPHTPVRMYAPLPDGTATPVRYDV